MLVGDLKLEYRKASGVPYWRQQLLVAENDEELQDDATMEDCGLLGDTILYIVIREKKVFQGRYCICCLASFVL